MQRPLNVVLAYPDRAFHCDRLAFMALVLVVVPVMILSAFLFTLNPLWFSLVGGPAYFFSVGATFIDPFWFRRWIAWVSTFGQPVRKAYGG
jgi:hypothetical protein